MLDLFPPTGQQQAVIDQRGANLLVLAGPGTGKTETLARRFASLVSDGVPPHQILVLTFSRRAADEMRDRVLLRMHEARGTGLAVSELFVKTFHSFCARLLDGERVPVRDRGLLTPVKERLLWRRLMRDTAPFESFDPSVAQSPQFATDCLNVIAQLKGRGISAERIATIAGTDPRLRDLASVYAGMEAQRLRLDLHDFRDLVNEAERALRDAGSPPSAWLRATGFRHVLVDEFQDSDRMQLKLLEAIQAVMSPAPCFCFVGDKNQSIYRFRGASPDNVDAAQQRFACTILELRDNRRSAQAILDVANVDASLDEASKTMAAEASHSGWVTFQRPRTVEDEVRSIREAVVRKIEAGSQARDVAVLLRQTRPYQELVMDALREAGVPVAAQPTAGFHADGLVDATLTALRLLAQPSDIALWQRLLVNPIVGYRPIDVRFAFDAGRRAGSTDPEAMLARTSPNGARPMRTFLAAWRRCRGAFERKGPRELLGVIVGELDLLRPVREKAPVEGFDRHASPARLAALLEAASDYEELAGPADGGDATCAAFIANLDETIALLADTRQAPPAASEGVRVISIHAAKGLEFDFVAIPQALEGVLPAGVRQNRLLPQRDIDKLRRSGADIFVDDDGARTEEHSLWYVALTRARSEVFVTAAQVEDDGVDLQASSFTRAIPTEEHVPPEVDVVGDWQVAPQREQPATQPDRKGAIFQSPPTGIVVPIEALSPTSIDRFISCPRRFYYGDVLRLPRHEDDSTRYGQRLHELLARLHETETDFEREHDADAIAARCRKTLRVLLSAEAVDDRGAVLQFEREDLARKLDEYVGLLAREAAASPFRVIARELVVSSRLDGLTIHGRVDRVDQLASGKLVIRDYKAGRKYASLAPALRNVFERLDAGDALFGDAPKGLNVQALLYIPGVEAHFNARVSAVEYIYFRGKSIEESGVLCDRTEIVDGEESGSKKSISRGEVERARRDLAARIARMCSDGSLERFATTVDEQRCTTCDYNRICPGAGAIPA